MRFSDFYGSGRFKYSFEVFPPKDETGVVNLIAALKKLAVFDPAFVSVTYGAMGTTRDLTRDLALRVRHETGLVTAFHFTCVGADRESVRAYVHRLKQEGIDLVVALRGDAPQGGERPASDFLYANELVSYLKEIDGFSIAVAGYPEGHVEAPDKETDLRNLKRKVEAGADVVLTQLFFDNRDYFDFVNRARKIGIAVPIVPGIMPILNLKQIEKITKMCGASLPPSLRDKLQRSGGDPEAMRRVGVEHAIAQCRELKARGVPGIHFYALNKAESVTEVIRSL
ncbi:MAG TPA: methylenetetrahydrofolate reductase [NAD(P)H] [bacterium]|nr:methylenetetrahydrofolate reductase [NAD(P)H] [bacterium]